MGCVMEQGDVNGIGVVRVRQRLPAAKRDFQEGDIVAAIDDARVRAGKLLPPPLQPLLVLLLLLLLLILLADTGS
jgi:hypothetical protein